MRKPNLGLLVRVLQILRYAETIKTGEIVLTKLKGELNCLTPRLVFRKNIGQEAPFSSESRIFQVVKWLSFCFVALSSQILRMVDIRSQLWTERVSHNQERFIAERTLFNRHPRQR